MRIQRGKVALQKVLVSRWADELAAYGLTSGDDAWTPTRLWCPVCGDRYLEAFVDRAAGTFILRCPFCYQTNRMYIANVESQPSLLHNVRGVKPMLNRATNLYVPLYRHAHRSNNINCPWCSARAYIGPMPKNYLPRRQDRRGLQLTCPRCRRTAHISIRGLVADQPVVEEFWREHRRIKTLPERDVVVNERPMIAVRLESVQSRAALDLIVDPETYGVVEHRTS